MARTAHDPTELARAREMLASAERSDLALYVGPNAADFLPVFDLAHAGRRGLLICWPAVLFGPAWLLYRKMFGLAALICSAPFIGGALHIGPDALRYLGFLPVIIGIFGRQIYVSQARATIARLRAEGHTDSETRRLISSAGGVSRAGAAIGIVIVAAPLLMGFMPAFVKGFTQSFNHATKADK